MGASTTQLQIWLDLARGGDIAARDQLIGATCERLRSLARWMLTNDRLRDWELTDDVLQRAMAKLHVSLQKSAPAHIREFLAIAGLYLRRAMIELARHYFGPHGEGTNRYNPGGAGPSVDAILNDIPANDPTPSQRANDAELYARLYAAVEQLSEDERELFDLLHLHGLTQSEAAELMGVSVSTVERMWCKIKVTLFNALGGELP